ncbi:MAG: tryptophan-rich sensory protein [Candidatus Blackburnbacteria bacterium]|nr:tryptophan-rich sensory protein [Candidatus Blackburnbacteria bacterium]
MAKKKKEAAKTKWGQLIAAIALCEGVGIAGSFFTVSSIPTWYATLNKPAFSPPNYLFAPVWTTLYALMGVALYLLWHNKEKGANILKNLFVLQLVLNAIWSPIFFGAQNIGLAFVVIIALWISIAALIYKAWCEDERVSLLLLPYLLWVSFAAVLNLFLWQLN